jgi:hypothetical protein
MLLSFQQDLNLTESELKRANEENRRLRQTRDQISDTADVAIMKSKLRKLRCFLTSVLCFQIQEYLSPSDPDPFLFWVFYLAGRTYISTVSNNFKERKTSIKMGIVQIFDNFLMIWAEGDNFSLSTFHLSGSVPSWEVRYRSRSGFVLKSATHVFLLNNQHS